MVKEKVISASRIADEINNEKTREGICSCC